MTTTAQPSSAAEAVSSAAAPLDSTASAAAPASSMASSAAPSSAAASSVASSTATSEASVASSAAAPAVPEKYDLKLPADAKVDAAIVERTAAKARALGLGNEAAQQILDAVVAEVRAADAARTAAWEPGKGESWTKRDTDWRAQALADTEIGGTEDKLKTSIELAQQAVGKYGDDGIREFLETTGLGSHPAAIKIFARIGRAMSESTLIVGTPAKATEKQSHSQRMYGPDGTGKAKAE